MGNIARDVCAKSNYDWLRIDKTLGYWKSDNKKKKKKKMWKNNVLSNWVPFWVKKQMHFVWFVCLFNITK